MVCSCIQSMYSYLHATGPFTFLLCTAVLLTHYFSFVFKLHFHLQKLLQSQLKHYLTVITMHTTTKESKQFLQRNAPIIPKLCIVCGQYCIFKNISIKMHNVPSKRNKKTSLYVNIFAGLNKFNPELCVTSVF